MKSFQRQQDIFRKANTEIYPQLLKFLSEIYRWIYITRYNFFNLCGCHRYSFVIFNWIIIIVHIKEDRWSVVLCVSAQQLKSQFLAISLILTFDRKFLIDLPEFSLSFFKKSGLLFDFMMSGSGRLKQKKKSRHKYLRSLQCWNINLALESIGLLNDAACNILKCFCQEWKIWAWNTRDCDGTTSHRHNNKVCGKNTRAKWGS